MKKILLFSFIASFAISGFAQGLVDIRNTGTCEEALDISRFKRFGPTTAPETADKGDALNFQYPKHPTWYSFKVPHDGILLFDIIPEKKTDNYDFLLFKGKENFCKEYNTGKVKPVRANLRPPTIEDGGRTGLSLAPQSPSYEKGIAVKEGETFYLALNNVFDGGLGHTVRLNFLETRQIHGEVTASRGGTHLSAEIEWVNLRDNDMKVIVETEKRGQYDMTIPLNSEQNAFPQYQLSVYADKYFPEIRIFSTPEARKLEGTEINFELEKIKKGLNNEQFGVIYFLPNEDKIEPQSDIVFKKLLMLMLKNPRVVVRLEGHTNGLYPSTDVDMRLSAERAIVVKEKLEAHGISEERIQIIGHGSSKTIFPFPEDEEQEGLNRRVEIFFDRF